MNIDERLLEIDEELSILNEERQKLETELRELKEDKWGEEGMRERLRKAILSRYGSVHPIKLAVLRLNGCMMKRAMTTRMHRWCSSMATSMRSSTTSVQRTSHPAGANRMNTGGSRIRTSAKA